MVRDGSESRGVLQQIFSSQVQYMIKYYTQSELRFCKMRGQKDLKSMKKVVNWIGNQEYNMLKNC